MSNNNFFVLSLFKSNMSIICFEKIGEQPELSEICADLHNKEILA